MRQHLIEKKYLEQFPILKERRASVLPRIVIIEVYCYCRSIHNGETMVKCSGGCSEKCISTPIETNRKWFCIHVSTNTQLCY